MSEESGRGRRARGEIDDASPLTGARRRRGLRGRLFELPVDEDVRREVRFHIAMTTEALMAEGWSEEAARAEAERRFGDRAEVEAEVRTIVQRQRRRKRRSLRLDAFVRDLRFGVRLLARQPGFTAVAVLTLALGIGANAAVFTVIRGLLLAPLRYPESDRIVTIWERTATGGQNRVAEPNYLDWKVSARTFGAMAAYRGPWLTPVLGTAEPQRRAVSIVTGDFFRVLGGRPLLGRLPEPQEVLPGAPPVLVVSQSFWESSLGGERDLSKLSLTIGPASAQVVAVMPAAFSFPDRTDIWVPRFPDVGGTRTAHNYGVIGRLAEGAPLEAARQEMHAIGQRLATEYAGEIDLVSVGITPLAEAMYGSYRQPLLLLLGAAGVVLLVACTNLASGLLARSMGREREMAVRASVGADRGRLVRQMLTESFLLSVAGGAAGLALAAALLRVLQATAPGETLRLRDIGVDGTVLGFTLLVCVLAAFAFGLLPALRSRTAGIATLLRSGGRAETGRGGRGWSALVTFEVALALVLLVMAGLLVRSFRTVMKADTGFDVADVVAIDVFVPEATYPSDTTVALLHARLVEQLAALPDVQSAGVGSMLPRSSSMNGGVDLEAPPHAYAEYRVADEGYFEALRIPLLRGRMFSRDDQLNTPHVALVDESFAARYFPNGDAVGRRIRNLRNDAFFYGEEAWLTIVGVVGGIRPFGGLQAAEPTVYVLSRQRAERIREATLVLRVRDASEALAAGIRSVMATHAPGVPFEIGSAEERVHAVVADRRFALLIVGVFAVLALTLAAAGIHGVVAWSVERRTREMGIRIALGAAPAGVARRIVLEAMRVVAAGLLLGILAAAAASPLVQSTLIGVGAFDPLTFLAVAGLLAGVALLAGALPARRITRIDPVAALRAD